MIIHYISKETILEDLRCGLITIEDLFDISTLKFNKDVKHE